MSRDFFCQQIYFGNITEISDKKIIETYLLEIPSNKHISTFIRGNYILKILIFKDVNTHFIFSFNINYFCILILFRQFKRKINITPT
mgnify:CR=1 FL=1